MRHQIGERGTIVLPLPTLCCKFVIPVGGFIEIKRRVSNQPGNPREVEVYVLAGVNASATGCDGTVTIHKVKLSKIWFEGEKVKEVS